jgi:hypothetical protein
MKNKLNNFFTLIFILIFITLTLIHFNALPESVYGYEPFNLMKHVVNFVDNYSLTLLLMTWVAILLLFYNDKLNIGNRRV